MKLMEEEKKKIRENVLKLHNIAKDAVKLCFESMKGNKSVLKEILKLEEESDKLEASIHDECSHFIMRFHPMVLDLRFSLGMMRISSAYERIVDLAHEVSLYECNFRQRIFDAENVITEMFDVVELGFNEGELREVMMKLDDRIDEIYIEVLEEIERDFRCVEEVLATRHIERIGDLLCKIATRIVYIREGKWVWIK